VEGQLGRGDGAETFGQVEVVCTGDFVRQGR